METKQRFSRPRFSRRGGGLAFSSDGRLINTANIGKQSLERQATTEEEDPAKAGYALGDAAMWPRRWTVPTMLDKWQQSLAKRRVLLDRMAADLEEEQKECDAEAERQRSMRGRGLGG